MCRKKTVPATPRVVRPAVRPTLRRGPPAEAEAAAYFDAAISQTPPMLILPL
ncbi:hypothetical protein MAUB1S_09818 [Mycolicibacterium aubagnense]